MGTGLMVSIGLISGTSVFNIENVVLVHKLLIRKWSLV